MEGNKDDIAFSQIKYDDYSSFNYLFEKYYGRLCAYVYGIIKNRNSAEDIVQELFINLWKSRHKIEIRESVLSYLFKASRNAALNYLRGEASRKKKLENYPIANQEINQDDLEVQEFISFVNDCIEELPDRSKQVFKMSRFEGLKQKEISEKLDISVKTIKNQIWKSLQYLKSCLELKDAL